MTTNYKSRSIGCAINVRAMDSTLVNKLIIKLKKTHSVSVQYQRGHLHKLYIHSFQTIRVHADYTYIEDKVDSSAFFTWVFANKGIVWLCI